MSHKQGNGPYGGVGGYLDDSLDEAQVKRILATLRRKVDADSFVKWLRRELASFRNLRQINGDLPGVVQDLSSARRLEAAISDLIRDLDEMSPTLADRLHADLLLHGRDEVSGITSKLTALQFSLLRVGVGLKDSPTPGRGRKRDALRDQFLETVADRLSSVGASRSMASAAAAEILVACGVVAPDGGRTRPDKRLGKN